MGRTSNPDLLKALKMAERGLRKAYVACGEPATRGAARAGALLSMREYVRAQCAAPREVRAAMVP